MSTGHQWGQGRHWASLASPVSSRQWHHQAWAFLLGPTRHQRAEGTTTHWVPSGSRRQGTTVVSRHPYRDWALMGNRTTGPYQVQAFLKKIGGGSGLVIFVVRTSGHLMMLEGQETEKNCIHEKQEGNTKACLISCMGGDLGQP